MKGRQFLHILLAGAFSVVFIPATGIAASSSETSSMKAYLEEQNPKSLDEYASIFEYLYDNHTAVIKEATQLTVLYFFSAADEPQTQDIMSLTNIAVISAIAQADAEMSQATVQGEDGQDNRGIYISEAVCGSFKGALGSAYKQVTSANQAVEGGLQAASLAGVDEDFASTVVTRGIDSCLEERLENDVRLLIEEYISDTNVCVSNCISTN
jgi:hypothetical protein